MRYTIATLISICFILSASPSFSHRGDSFDIRIVPDKGGEFLTVPFKDTKRKRTHVIKKYLEAKKGENYSITIKNNTAGRIGVVIAVDGRNIITGKKSFLKNNEDMYIVNPYGYTKLEGWRTDQNTVYRFYFTDKSDSYTIRTFGDSSAIGVIAVTVFREKERPEILYEKQMRGKKVPGAASRPSAKSESGLYESDTAGTGFGYEKYSPAVKVKFEPERVPSKKLLVKYEWHEILCNKGLIKCWQEEHNRLWDEDEYAPFPPGYIYR